MTIKKPISEHNLLEHWLLWTRFLHSAFSEACLSLIVLISSWQNVTSTGLAWVCSRSRYPTYALKPNKKCQPGLWYLKQPKRKIFMYSPFCKHPLFWVWTYIKVNVCSSTQFKTVYKLCELHNLKFVTFKITKYWILTCCTLSHPRSIYTLIAEFGCVE